MKTFKILLSASMLLFASIAFGQSEKNVSVMKEGTKLTDSDIAFLTMVSGGSPDANRGAANQEVTISNVKYSVGKTLSKSEATSLNKAVKEFQKKYRAPEGGTRGAGWCYYWYYYCDGWGYCWWYKYWYICY